MRFLFSFKQNFPSENFLRLQFIILSVAHKRTPHYLDVRRLKIIIEQIIYCVVQNVIPI